MNLNTLAHLIRPDVTTCAVRFATGSQKDYTFKISTDLADRIAQGLLEPGQEVPVVVDTCNGLRVAYVTGVHDESRVDPEDDVNYAWVFQIVDTDAKVRQEQVETQIVTKLKNRRKLSHKQQALAALGISNPDEFIRQLSAPKD